MNPEFVRNLWLQLSPQRLIAAPLVIGLGFALAYLGDMPRDEIAKTAEWLFYAVVAFWGTRRAADSVAEEVAGGTWDSQRMSALGAWAMCWGKLLGGTVFVWYCAGLLLLAHVFGAWPARAADQLVYDLAILIATGLLGQAVAMVTCLTILGRGAQGRRLPVTMSQLTGLLAVALVGSIGPIDHLADGFEADPILRATWYGLPVLTQAFVLLSLASFLAWALVAIYRLMRVELQYRSYPFVWIAFVAFVAAYANGFASHWRNGDLVPSDWLFVPAIVATALTYVVLFLQPKDVVRYRWLAAAVAGGDLRRALALTPLWLPTFIIAVALTLAYAALHAGHGLPLAYAWDPSRLVDVQIYVLSAALAVPLFMARDIAIVLFLNFNSRRKRADLAALIYLIVLYAVLPSVLGLIEAGALLPLFLPVPGSHTLVSVLPPLVEAAIMVSLLIWRLTAARPKPVPVAAS